jgi:asparagine synthase (glutamine-hydrolysing)
MSGLVGTFNVCPVVNQPLVIGKMAELIKHVQSDHTDIWGDGHLEIARVHHNTINREKQPIMNEDNSLLVAMDGEIFDYGNIKRELISKGHRFRFGSNDAEFCLHLYEEFGTAAFIKLNGSFIIVLYDLIKKQLTIVNDRLASRPLYYYLSDRLLVFGSEVKSVIQHNHVPRLLNKIAVVEYFTFRRVLGTNTYYKDILCLPPATLLQFRDNSQTQLKYWEMHFQEDRAQPLEYYVDSLTIAFKQAVKRRMGDDRRYGLLLSGGLDSRMVLAAAPSNCSLTAFTMADWENREIRIARKLAEAKGVKFVLLNKYQDYAADLVPQVSELAEGMYNCDFGSPIGIIEAIREMGTEIIFHGYGLDVMFQGLYLPNTKMNISGREIPLPLMPCIPSNVAGLSKEILRKLKYVSDEKTLAQLLNEDFFKGRDEWIQHSVQEILIEASKHATNPYNRWDYFVSYFMSKHYTYIFELEMRNYMEERTILFDNDLLDVYLKTPPHFRFNSKVYRKVLRNLSPGLADIPNANTGMSPSTHPAIEFAYKYSGIALGKLGLKSVVPDPTFSQGSWPNIGELIRRNDAMRSHFQNVICDDEAIDSIIFNKTYVKESFDKHISGEIDYTNYLLLILSFGMWYKNANIANTS